MPLTGIQLCHSTVPPKWFRSAYYWTIHSICWCSRSWLLWKSLP